MLKEVTDYSQLTSLDANPFSAKIQALYKTYSNKYNFANFWVQNSSTAISDVDGNITICCNEYSDFEELKLFIEFRGYKSISLNEEFSSIFNKTYSDSSFIVEYSACQNTESIVCSKCYKPVYNILCECGFKLGDYSSYLEDFALRVNKNAAKVITLESENKVVATASALFIGDNSVLLGAVGTLPECRKNGYASVLIKSLADEFISKNKKVYLFCRNDGLLEFYKKIGFIEYGRWALLS